METRKNTRNKRKKTEKRTRKKIKIRKQRVLWVLIYLSAVVILAFLIYAVPSMLGFFERTYVAEHGDIDVSIDSTAYVLREENVYVSSRGADINRLAEEGELVRGGTSIVELSGKDYKLGKDKESKYADVVKSLGVSKIVTDNGVSQQSGYISYNVDGAEGKLTYASLKSLSKSDIETIADISVVAAAKSKCYADEPLFKIVDNGAWWIVLYVGTSDGKRFVEGNSVQLTVGDETVRAYVDSISKGKGDESGNTRIVLKCNVNMEGYLTARKVSAKITTESAEGLIIKNSSIVKKDGVQGVLTVNKLDKHVFKPIQVLADDGENSCISEGYFMDDGGNMVKTLSTYDEVVTSPSKSDVENAEV